MRKTALISVFDKTGIIEFATKLSENGYDLVASGGTAKKLIEAGLTVTDVADFVGGGAILGHRVVTLSREIHAALLARDVEEDQAELDRLEIPRIDLVCCDMYPLHDAIAKSNVTQESVIESTDIGGPTMIRSAAKGRRFVICTQGGRKSFMQYLESGIDNEEQEEVFRTALISIAEGVVSEYCLSSARYHSRFVEGGAIDGMVGVQCRDDLKYGENGYQTPARLFKDQIACMNDPLAIPNFKVIAGNPGFVNLTDLDRLLQTVTHIAAGFELNRGRVPFIAVGVKHGNPCGAAYDFGNPEEVLRKMLTGDLRAIFGGLIMTNFQINLDRAQILLTHEMPDDKRRLLDGIIAPEISANAADLLQRKNGRCSLITNEALLGLKQESLDDSTRFRPVRGGFLTQPNYTFVMNFNDEDMVCYGSPEEAVENDLLLAWAIGSTSNSNTITIVKDGMLIANGVGQQDRVGCCEVALEIRARDAGHSPVNAVAYSDSFFPFADGPAVLADHGIKAVLSSSGSMGDEEVISLLKQKGILTYLIPDRKARGFFGH